MSTTKSKIRIYDDVASVDQESIVRPSDIRDWDQHERDAYFGAFNRTDLRDRVVYHPILIADDKGAREIVLQMEHGRRPTTIDTIDEDGAYAMAQRLNERVTQQMSEA